MERESRTGLNKTELNIRDLIVSLEEWIVRNLFEERGLRIWYAVLPEVVDEKVEGKDGQARKEKERKMEILIPKLESVVYTFFERLIEAGKDVWRLIIWFETPVGEVQIIRVYDHGQIWSEEITVFVPYYQLTDNLVGEVGGVKIHCKEWESGYHVISFVKDSNYPWIEVYGTWFPDDERWLVLEGNFWHEVSLPIGELDREGNITLPADYEISETTLRFINYLSTYLQALGIMKVREEEDIMGYEYKKS